MPRAQSSTRSIFLLQQHKFGPGNSADQAHRGGKQFEAVQGGLTNNARGPPFQPAANIQTGFKFLGVRGGQHSSLPAQPGIFGQSGHLSREPWGLIVSEIGRCYMSGQASAQTDKDATCTCPKQVGHCLAASAIKAGRCCTCSAWSHFSRRMGLQPRAKICILCSPVSSLPAPARL